MFRCSGVQVFTSSGFRVQVLGSRVLGSGFRVQGFRVQGFRVQGFEVCQQDWSESCNFFGCHQKLA